VQNLIDDPNETDQVIQDVRGAKAKLDASVCRAYSWSDIELEGYPDDGSKL